MSAFDQIADLKLEVDGYALVPQVAELSAQFTRHTTLVELSGGGLTGVGEDVVYEESDQAAFQQAGPIHDLAGSWTLASFCDLVESLELFPHPPGWEVYRNYRLWAFESAALDLALRQAELPLGRVLQRDPSPMRYVASTRLGEPPSLAPVTRRLALDANLRFKLDATSSWTPQLLEALVATASVDSIDLKGLYPGNNSVHQPADPLLYRRVAAAFPNAWLEDPDLTVPEAAAALADEHERITWDASIHSVEDIRALPFQPRMVNIKPSRFGTLARLLEAYEYCGRYGIGAYGGGQSELGVGRGQAQYLAALFHPDAPNDLAPSAYNLADPPAGLPASPLIADLGEPGFRWPEDVGA